MKLLDRSALLSTAAPWFLSVACSPSELTDLSWAIQREDLPDGVVRHIRGRKMRTVPSLFDEIAAALQFPYYFGENWDALDECLNDLEWLPGKAYLVIISDAVVTLAAEAPEKLSVFVNVLKRTCEEWSAGTAEGQPWDRPPTPFHILLQCLEGETEELARRFRSSGAELVGLPVIR